MIIFGIDPGPRESAYVFYDGKIGLHDYRPNDNVLQYCQAARDVYGVGAVVIEWIEGYGLTVGRETFDTCRWVGRFEQAAGGCYLLGRKAIKSHLCGTTQAKDRDIRAALIDRFGEPGTKRLPGPTFGITGDEWSALACAVVWSDLHKGDKPCLIGG